jgi:hypothetical protein
MQEEDFDFSPSELENILVPCGFRLTAFADIGLLNYLSLFVLRS